MQNLYKLVYKLKTDLISCEGDLNKIDNILSIKDIHRIRKGLDKIEDGTFDKRGLEFLDHYHDFDSIVNYFYNLSSYETNVEPYLNIIITLDQLLNHLLDNNYEILVRKINKSNIVEDGFDSIVFLMEEMEKAFLQKDFATVTTLSSSILTSIFKDICVGRGIEYNDKDNFNILYNKIKDNLRLNPIEYKHKPKLRTFTSKINLLIKTINEIRNLYSSSHGNTKDKIMLYESVPPHHIKLIIDTTKTIANFIIETNFYQQNSLKI